MPFMMGGTATELVKLAEQLRSALPHQAPIRIAEMVQHCIVRLELLARSPAPDDRRVEQQHHAEQLLELCLGYGIPERRRLFADE